MGAGVVAVGVDRRRQGIEVVEARGECEPGVDAARLRTGGLSADGVARLCEDPRQRVRPERRSVAERGRRRLGRSPRECGGVVEFTEASQFVRHRQERARIHRVECAVDGREQRVERVEAPRVRERRGGGIRSAGATQCDHARRDRGAVRAVDGKGCVGEAEGGCRVAASKCEPGAAEVRRHGETAVPGGLAERVRGGIRSPEPLEHERPQQVGVAVLGIEVAAGETVERCIEVVERRGVLAPRECEPRQGEPRT